MQIKEAWKSHSLYKQGKVELVPTEWVWKYWGRDVSPKTDLSDGSMVNLNELWENILDVGLQDPLIMRVGLKDNNFRLESGNHRIQVLYKNGVKKIPLTVQVKKECGPQAEDLMTDASHNFVSEKGFLVREITEEYMRPSEVFAGIKKTI